MRKLLIMSTLLLGTAIAHANADTVSSTTYDQFGTSGLGTVAHVTERVPDQAAVFAAFAAQAASNGCATGIERCATPMTLSNCPPGMYWTTEGTGIAHCIYPPPPPPPVVYVPWEPPTVVGDSGGGGGGGGGSAPAPSAPFDYCAAFGWCADAPLTSTTPPTPMPPDPVPPIVTNPPEGCVWCPPPTVIHTPTPVVTAPPPAPVPERLVWAYGSVNMGQTAGPDAAAQYAQGEAYGAGQFNYVSQHYGNGDHVPYPVQTWSEYTASMVASGCSASSADPSGFQCR